jgi:hypothetical protein
MRSEQEIRDYKAHFEQLAREAQAVIAAEPLESETRRQAELQYMTREHVIAALSWVLEAGTPLLPAGEEVVATTIDEAAPAPQPIGEQRA